MSLYSAINCALVGLGGRLFKIYSADIALNLSINRVIIIALSLSDVVGGIISSM
jgi:hypothetical protein